MMSAAVEDEDAVARAERLVRLFHPDPRAFGVFSRVRAAEVPEPFRGLLDHASHMTVAMERFYGGAVDVVVAAVRTDGDAAAGGRGWYEREILLRSAAGRLVQHGIVRIDLSCVAGPVADRIRAGKQPLGRILMAADMLLAVQRVSLVAVEIGPEFRRLLQVESPVSDAVRQTFGRVAEITLDGAPAVELLEIVVPGPLPKVLR